MTENTQEEEEDQVVPISESETLTNKLPQTKEKGSYLTLAIITLGTITVLVLLFLVYLLFSPFSIKKTIPKASGPVSQATKVTSNLSPTLKPSPTPIPLPRGPREYGVSNKDNPQISDLRLTEFSPKIGEKQSVTVSILDKKDGKVVSVILRLTTDNKSKDYTMSLTSGSDKNGEWTASWITEDTHDYIYNMVITATNGKGEKVSINPTFR